MELATRFRSTFMRVVSSQRRQRQVHRRARLRRRLSGKAPSVHYFHEVSDPYSHLAVQKLDALRASYDIDFSVHLTSAAEDAYRGDAARYPQWALADAISVAPFYGVHLASDSRVPEADQVRAVESKLALVVGSSDFAVQAQRSGESLWSSQSDGVSQASLDAAVIKGNQLRARWGHYAGGMFYFEGEWYWGLDRLYLLEQRLVDEGFGSGPIVVPRPTPAATDVNASAVTLEYFPSLRSPYTAISFDRTMAIADRTGVKLDIRPVLPMMMRGVPAPREKASYIMADAAREARAAGEDFGRIIDPFGDPVRRAFALLPHMIEHDKVREFTGRYLDAAWKDGTDITQESGLARVVTDVGLEWSQAKASMSNTAWEDLLENNVNDMLEMGLWGVPSFRVTSPGAAPFSCWGQDRLWRVEQEIIERASVGQ